MNDRAEPTILIDTSELPCSGVLFTTADVALMLQVGIRTVWRMVKTGRLPPPVRLNRKFIRWRQSDLQAWIDSIDAAGLYDPDSPLQPAREAPADLILLEEAADLLHCHYTSVVRFAQDGRLHTFRQGARYSVSRAEVLGLIVPSGAASEVTRAA